MRGTQALSACALMTLALWIHPAPAEDLTIFGIPLGARLQIPECDRKSVAGLALYQQATTACFERLGSEGHVRAIAPIGNESIVIKYPVTEAPSVMSGGTAIGLVVDGSLEGVAFITRGVDAQPQVMEVLKQKFGEPTSLMAKQVQNSLGVTFDVFDAGWTLPQVEILFRSVTSRVDSGLLSIDTGRGRQHRERPLDAPGGDDRGG